MSDNYLFGREKTCIDCDKTFFISDREFEFYRKKRLYAPKRCKRCRDSRRQIKPSKYDGLYDILPGLYKGRPITGGIDITDISGYKWGVSGC